MVKNEEGFYSFSYNGKKIGDDFSIDETRDFLEELLGDTNKYPKESILEYLDELIEIANKSRISGFKLKPMLRKYLGEDIGIHPYTREPSVFPTRVKYFDEIERNRNRVSIENGRIINSNRRPFDSLNIDAPFNNGKAIFVVDSKGNIFTHTNPYPGQIHHSSFLKGEPVVMAGEIEVFNGILIGITNNTGHYHTKEKHIIQFLEILKKKGVDIQSVEITIY